MIYNEQEYDNSKNQNKIRYGLFIYNKSSDEFIYGLWSNRSKELKTLWNNITISSNEYAEVWKKDKQGLFGNCGSPILKSYFD